MCMATMTRNMIRHHRKDASALMIKYMYTRASESSDWVDACCRLLSPLEEALQDYVLTDGKLHADDTPVPVLLPGNKKTKTGRLWTYVRDDRNAGSTLAPAVWFAYSPDRKGIHPQTHLAGFSGVLQADAVTNGAIVLHTQRLKSDPGGNLLS